MKAQLQFKWPEPYLQVLHAEKNNSHELGLRSIKDIGPVKNHWQGEMKKMASELTFRMKNQIAERGAEKDAFDKYLDRSEVDRLNECAKFYRELMDQELDALSKATEERKQELLEVNENIRRSLSDRREMTRDKKTIPPKPGLLEKPIAHILFTLGFAIVEYHLNLYAVDKSLGLQLDESRAVCFGLSLAISAFVYMFGIAVATKK